MHICYNLFSRRKIHGIKSLDFVLMETFSIERNPAKDHGDTAKNSTVCNNFAIKNYYALITVESFVFRQLCKYIPSERFYH